MSNDADAIKKAWLLQNKPVCICKGIKGKTITAAIKKGADTVEKVNQRTGSGSGGCGGKRCSVTINELLGKKTD